MSVVQVDSWLKTTNAPSKKPSSLFFRTPWRPPVGVSAEGIWITLDDGRKLIDAVGGAAVACIGGNHPAVAQARLTKFHVCLSQQNGIMSNRFQMCTVCNCQMNLRKP